MDIREYEKSQRAALKRIDRVMTRKRFGDFAPWAPRIQWVAALLTFAAITTGELDYARQHWSNMAALIGGGIFFAVIAHNLSGAALEWIAGKLRKD